MSLILNIPSQIPLRFRRRAPILWSVPHEKLLRRKYLETLPTPEMRALWLREAATLYPDGPWRRMKPEGCEIRGSGTKATRATWPPNPACKSNQHNAMMLWARQYAPELLPEAYPRPATPPVPAWKIQMGIDRDPEAPGRRQAPPKSPTEGGNPNPPARARPGAITESFMIAVRELMQAGSLEQFRMMGRAIELVDDARKLSTDERREFFRWLRGLGERAELSEFLMGAGDEPVGYEAAPFPPAGARGTA